MEGLKWLALFKGFFIMMGSSRSSCETMSVLRFDHAGS